MTTPERLLDLAGYVEMWKSPAESSESAEVIDELLAYAALLRELQAPSEATEAAYNPFTREPPHCPSCDCGIPHEPLSAQWIEVTERMPESGVYVLIFVLNSFGNGRRLRAKWCAKHSEEQMSDDGDGDYSEEKDTYYVPEGWYETNEYEETHWYVHDPVSHWMPLPSPPLTKDGSRG